MGTQVKVTRTFDDGRKTVWYGVAKKLTTDCVLLEEGPGKSGYLHVGRHVAPDPRWSMTTVVEAV